MLKALGALASFLARDPLTVAQVVAELGTVTHDYRPNVIVAPFNPLFREANVVRGIDLATRKHGDSPALVELVPAEPPAVEELEAAFGAYTPIPAEDKGVLPQAIFYLEMPEQPCMIALIAAVQGERAVAITLRRDKIR